MLVRGSPARSDAVSGGAGVLFMASGLFPRAAAEEAMTRTREGVAQGRLPAEWHLAETLAVDRESCAAALAELRPDERDALVIQMSTFCTAELLETVLDSLGDRSIPIAVWALEESGKIVTNSLCGAQLWMSTLDRLGRDAAFFLGNVGDGGLADELTAFAAAARASAKVRGARIALVGGHAEWFTNIAVDGWALRRRLGVIVDHVSLPAFLDKCDAAEEGDAAASRWADVAVDGADPAAARQTIGRSFARLEAGLNGLDADGVALRDWPEILYSDRFQGTWPALGALSERAVPLAPEGDVMGAVTAVAARGLAPDSLPFLTDISGIDRARERLVLWHYGVSPHLAAGPRSVTATLKEESFSLKPGEMTLLRFSQRADGAVRLFISEGRISEEPTGANRASGYFEPDMGDAEGWMQFFVERRYEHHVTALYGRWARAARHMARQLGIEVDCV